ITSGRQLRIATHGRGLWQIPVFGPTAANVTISGRIMDQGGQGIRGAIVAITDSTGKAKSAVSSTFGYYSFDEIATGQTYIIGVNSKRYQFTPKSITVNDQLSGVDFVAESPWAQLMDIKKR
ncbi:MAG TPA: carboxypeptidase-like regulatory domain-containing protein, partial [Pyrinomonadaceae bacterium]|nr:carboxypeptidase-like regulatory domain-containing protein [Pyrinomonadaceae bacterium]